MPNLNYQDIAVTRREHLLILENRCLRRTVDLSAGYPHTVSLIDRETGREYAAATHAEPDAGFIGITRPGRKETVYRLDGVTSRSVPASLFDSEHVEVEIRYSDPVQNVRFRRVFILYPDLPAISVYNTIESAVMPNCYWLHRRRMADTTNLFFPAAEVESCADRLELANDLRPDYAVEFLARTDHNDDLVKRHPAAGQTRLCGNQLWCRFPDAAGVLFLQEAPPSEERRDFEEHDFRIENGTVYSCGWGVPPGEINPETEFIGYRHTIITASGPAARDRALKAYLKRRFPLDASNCNIMVNPWGCGNFRDRVSEEFLKAEIAAAGRIGADSYQIDDTWQEGAGLGEMIDRNRHMTPEFWHISQSRLQGTFAALLPVAEAAGVELALWCAPSSNAEYRDWPQFLEFLLDFHRRWGFRHFKIDGVLIRTYEAERNLESLLREARAKTGGAIYFNLDTTAGQRPGYFLFLEYGNIFLQNRYVCHNWGLGYHPEKTLRSLWKLSHHMRAQMLQIEIPNPGDINRDFYTERGMTMPDTYPLEYWAAIACFANPLLWMAPSTLDAETERRFTAAVAMLKSHRAAILCGEIYPIGTQPDGQALTGFHSTAGYLIVYREMGAPAAGLLELPQDDTPGSAWELIGGSGSATAVAGGVQVSVAEHPRFALFKKLS